MTQFGALLGFAIEAVAYSKVAERLRGWNRNPGNAGWQRDLSVSYKGGSHVYRRTGNLIAVQLLLGHSKIESTVRYLGIEVDDAIEIAEKIDI